MTLTPVTLTYAEICDAITATLAVAPSIARAMSYDELTEGMQDQPAFQVYPEGCDPVAARSETHVTTLRGGVIQETHTIHVDYYARQRSHIGEDMAVLVEGVDEIVPILEGETCPPFGLSGIKNFQWSWNRVVFDYGGVMYMGARFTLRLMTF